MHLWYLLTLICRKKLNHAPLYEDSHLWVIQSILFQNKPHLGLLTFKLFCWRFSHYGEVSNTLSGLQSTCDCRYHCLLTLHGHYHRSRPQPVKMTAEALLAYSLYELTFIQICISVFIIALPAKGYVFEWEVGKPVCCNLWTQSLSAPHFHLALICHQLTCKQPVILPASRCVSCSSSVLACCPLLPTLPPVCYCTLRSPLWRLVLFRAAWYKAMHYPYSFRSWIQWLYKTISKRNQMVDY